LRANVSHGRAHGKSAINGIEGFADKIGAPKSRRSCRLLWEFWDGGVWANFGLRKKRRSTDQQPLTAAPQASHSRIRLVRRSMIGITGASPQEVLLRVRDRCQCVGFIIPPPDGLC
jgi:hypothetical protein